MSYQKIKKIPLTPNTPRDFYQPYAESASKTIDLLEEFHAFGLDILLHNRGASSLTISIDKATAITVLAGESLSWSDIKYSLVEVTSSVAYDLVLAGVTIKEEMRKFL